MEKKFELTDKELYCIARMMQGLIFMDNAVLYSGCYYCKYQLDCLGYDFHFDNIVITKLRTKLEDATGVYLGLITCEPLKMIFFNDSFADNYPEKYKELIEKRDMPFSDELDFTPQEIIDLKRSKK